MNNNLQNLKNVLLNFKEKLLIHKSNINNTDFILDKKNLNIAYIPLFNPSKSINNNHNYGFLSIFGIVALIIAFLITIIGFIIITKGVN